MRLRERPGLLKYMIGITTAEPIKSMDSEFTGRYTYLTHTQAFHWHQTSTAAKQARNPERLSTIFGTRTDSRSFYA